MSTTDISQGYRRAIGRRTLILLALVAAGLAAMVADLVVGAGTLTLPQVVAGLISPSPVAPDDTRRAVGYPRAGDLRRGRLTGISLALSGSLMQTC